MHKIPDKDESPFTAPSRTTFQGLEFLDHALLWQLQLLKGQKPQNSFSRWCIEVEGVRCWTPTKPMLAGGSARWAPSVRLCQVPGQLTCLLPCQRLRRSLAHPAPHSLYSSFSSFMQTLVSVFFVYNYDLLFSFFSRKCSARVDSCL